MTADTALRLSKPFDLSDGFWSNLQKDYETAITKDEIAATRARSLAAMRSVGSPRRRGCRGSGRRCRLRGALAPFTFSSSSGYLTDILPVKS